MVMQPELVHRVKGIRLVLTGRWYVDNVHGMLMLETKQSNWPFAPTRIWYDEMEVQEVNSCHEKN